MQAGCRSDYRSRGIPYIATKDGASGSSGESRKRWLLRPERVIEDRQFAGNWFGGTGGANATPGLKFVTTGLRFTAALPRRWREWRRGWHEPLHLGLRKCDLPAPRTAGAMTRRRAPTSGANSSCRRFRCVAHWRACRHFSWRSARRCHITGIRSPSCVSTRPGDSIADLQRLPLTDKPTMRKGWREALKAEGAQALSRYNRRVLGEPLIFYIGKGAQESRRRGQMARDPLVGSGYQRSRDGGLGKPGSNSAPRIVSASGVIACLRTGIRSRPSRCREANLDCHISAYASAVQESSDTRLRSR